MMWWWLLPAFVALLLFCPVYLYAYYDGEFRIAVRVLFVKFRIPVKKFGADKKSSKPKKSSKRTAGKKQKNRKFKTDGGGFLSQLNNFKDMLISARTHILKAFRIKRFKADITVASGDPCTTALLFGGVNAAAFTLISVIDALVCVDTRDINIAADYSSDKTEVYIDVIFRTFLYKLLIGLILFALDGTIKSKE